MSESRFSYEDVRRVIQRMTPEEIVEAIEEANEKGVDLRDHIRALLELVYQEHGEQMRIPEG